MPLSRMLRALQVSGRFAMRSPSLEVGSCAGAVLLVVLRAGVGAVLLVVLRAGVGAVLLVVLRAGAGAVLPAALRAAAGAVLALVLRADAAVDLRAVLPAASEPSVDLAVIAAFFQHPMGIDARRLSLISAGLHHPPEVKMPGPREFLIPAGERSALRDHSRLLRLSITQLR